MANASSKQIRYIHGMLGLLIDVGYFQTRTEAWDALELLQETKLNELDGKQASSVIKTLKTLTEQYG